MIRVWHDVWYEESTVYLPDELKAALKRAATGGRNEAELIREAVRVLTQGSGQPEPRSPLFSSGDPTLAGWVDEELVKGLGLS